MNDSLPKTANSTGLKPSDSAGADPENLSGKELMEAVLSRPRRTGDSEREDLQRINGVVIGTFSGLGDDGQAMVRYEGSPIAEDVPALSAVALTDFDSGRQVALSFIQGNPHRPMILGMLHQPAPTGLAAAQHWETPNPELDVTLDGERVTLSASDEIVLKCGKSSITLTRAGKVIIKGEYLSNHSAGVNRIKGGSVQIN